MINTWLSSIFVIYPFKEIEQNWWKEISVQLCLVNPFSSSSVNSRLSMDEGPFFRFKNMVGITTKMTRHLTFQVFSKFQWNSLLQNCVRILVFHTGYNLFLGKLHFYWKILGYPEQWRLVVKLPGTAAKFHLWLNIWDCRPGCFYNIVAFPVTPAVLILSNS